LLDVRPKSDLITAFSIAARLHNFFNTCSTDKKRLANSMQTLTYAKPQKLGTKNRMPNIEEVANLWYLSDLWESLMLKGKSMETGFLPSSDVFESMRRHHGILP
jgi:hypothetical protein